MTLLTRLKKLIEVQERISFISKEILDVLERSLQTEDKA